MPGHDDQDVNFPRASQLAPNPDVRIGANAGASHPVGNTAGVGTVVADAAHPRAGSPRNDYRPTALYSEPTSWRLSTRIDPGRC
ncbi:hypothetical protein F4559_001772 [Saccharothrix violaceirubra]|uniref:Uncharacterized protein n=1 Tax=Saccharothrix violaceirubra TaxID=413306 RepID=A0A7W7WVD2_9PSEU|nr:hypothetical protein [Saccharothrix violaceirubra]